jgi:hypothetical protein
VGPLEAAHLGVVVVFQRGDLARGLLLPAAHVGDVLVQPRVLLTYLAHLIHHQQ